MKAREFAKRAMIYGLGLTLYVYELFVATVEGLGLNTRGFWGEPTRPDESNPNVAPAVGDPIAQARAEMLECASRDFEAWQTMTPAERAASIQARSNPPPSQKEKLS